MTARGQTAECCPGPDALLDEPDSPDDGEVEPADELGLLDDDAVDELVGGAADELVGGSGVPSSLGVDDGGDELDGGLVGGCDVSLLGGGVVPVGGVVGSPEPSPPPGCSGPGVPGGVDPGVGSTVDGGGGGVPTGGGPSGVPVPSGAGDSAPP